MKLAYLGGYFANEYATENDICRAFSALGWEVEHFAEAHAGGKRYLDRIDDADLFLYTLGHGTPIGTDASWRAIEERGIPTAGVHLDLFWGLERQELIHTAPFFRLGYLFTADGGHDELWESEGIRHHWMPPAIAADRIERGEPRDEYECDVLFVGSSRRYHPEWPWRRTMLDAVEREFGDRFLMLGPQVARAARGSDLSNAIASCKVVIGDSLMLSDHYWSDRVPETMGRAGALVHPLLPDARLGLAAGVDYMPYEVGDVAKMLDVIHSLVDDDDRRARMSWHAMFETRRAHTYGDRVRRIILPTIGEDWECVRSPETCLRMLARDGSTDQGVIDEVWRDDVYGINGQRFDGQTVVDLGANIGAFSLRAASLGARVIAVEPEVGNRAVLVRAAKMAGLDHLIDVRPVAVGAERGRCNVTGSGGAAMTHATLSGSVEMLPLDELLPNEVALLKTDTEGAEFDALGASKRLDVCDRIVGEWHERDAGPRLGEMVRHLLQTHAVSVSGTPDVIGSFDAQRYER